jgi:5-formyltetrahydrofolate cyclo-ligase
MEDTPAHGRPSKHELRAAIHHARDRVDAGERARASAAIVAALHALPEIAAARMVFCFASFRSEVDTLPFIEDCLRAGKAVAVPRVLGPRHMEAFLVTRPATDLVTGTWGIPEPRETLLRLDPQRIDAVVLPGLAFDTSGGRIGYGGGFYDTYLPRLHHTVPRIGVAFEVQLVDHVPRDGHDHRVDVIVTERRVIRVGEGA